MSGFGRIHIRYEGRVVDAFFQVCRYVFKTSWLLQCSVGLVGRPLRSSDWGQSCWKHGGYSQHTPQHLTETSTTDTVLLTVCVCVCKQHLETTPSPGSRPTGHQAGRTARSTNQTTAGQPFLRFCRMSVGTSRDSGGRPAPWRRAEADSWPIRTWYSCSSVLSLQILFLFQFQFHPFLKKKLTGFSSLCPCQIDKSNSGHTRNRCSRTGDVSCLIKR